MVNGTGIIKPFRGEVKKPGGVQVYNKKYGSLPMKYYLPMKYGLPVEYRFPVDYRLPVTEKEILQKISLVMDNRRN